MEVEQAYKLKRSAQLKEWGAQLDLLEAKVENANADIRVRHAVELDELRGKQRTASWKMQELEKASGEAWAEIKVAADTIWEDLKAGMAAAQARFK
jgi:hypothetical protein